MLTRLRNDFGAMRIESLRSTGEGVEVLVSGSTGMQARVMLGLPPDAPIDREPLARELTRFVLLGCGLAPD